MAANQVRGCMWKALRGSRTHNSTPSTKYLMLYILTFPPAMTSSRATRASPCKLASVHALSSLSREQQSSNVALLRAGSLMHVFIMDGFRSNRVVEQSACCGREVVTSLGESISTGVLLDDEMHERFMSLFLVVGGCLEPLQGLVHATHTWPQLWCCLRFPSCMCPTSTWWSLLHRAFTDVRDTWTQQADIFCTMDRNSECCLRICILYV